MRRWPLRWSLFWIVPVLAGAAPLPDPVEGKWLTEKQNGIVEIFRCGGAALCGRLLWLRIPPAANNPQAVDHHNPAPELRGRSLCGLVMMGGLTPDEPGAWHDGWIYDPQSGKTYRGNMALEPDGRLRLRGYVGIPLFGETQLWTRFSGAVPPCPGR